MSALLKRVYKKPMRRLTNSLLLFLFCVSFNTLLNVLPVLAEITEGGTGLAYGDGHAYFLTAPNGWMLDTESAAEQKIYAAFYPKGSSWADGAAVMYSSADAIRGRTLDQAIEDDYNALRKKSPKLAMEDGGTLSTKDNKQAQIRYFKNDKWGNYEACGYVLEPTVVANIVLTARNKEAFEQSLPAFKQLLGSYRFVTAEPNKVDLRALVKEEHDKEVQEKAKHAKESK